MAVIDDLENLGKQIPPESLDKVGSILVGIKNEVKSLIDSNTALSGENKRRRLEAEEVKSKLTDVEIERDRVKKEIEEYGNSSESSKARIEALQQEVNSYLDIQRKDVSGYIEKHAADPKFEKAKTMFVLPEQDEEKKYQWDKLDQDAVKRNIAAKSQLESLNYFEATQQEPEVFKGKGQMTMDGKVIPTITEAAELKAKFGQSSPQYRQALDLRMQAKAKGIEV